MITQNKLDRLIEISKKEGSDSCFVETESGGDFYQVMDYSTKNSKKIKIGLPGTSAFFPEGGSPKEQSEIEISLVGNTIIIAGSGIPEKQVEFIVDEIIRSSSKESNINDDGKFRSGTSRAGEPLNKNVKAKKTKDFFNRGSYLGGTKVGKKNAVASGGINRIEELEKLVEHHKTLYQTGRPEISDSDYDKLEEELNSLRNATKQPKDSTKYYRLQLIENAESTCQYCRRRLPVDLLEIDHFLPVSKYPEKASNATNMIVSCRSCNIRKGTYDPINEPIYNPMDGIFKENFKVIRESGEIEPLTEIARRSVNLFDINSNEYVEHRKIFYSIMDDTSLGDPWAAWGDWLLKKDKENEKKVRRYITSSKFLHDSLSEEDFIGGRKEFAKILTSKISDIFEDKKHEGPFMLHLGGRWGSGKSTFMDYFKDEMSSTGKWMVVDFDSWRYQHFIPNWWGFLEQIKLGMLCQVSPWHKRLQMHWSLFFYRFKKILGFSFYVGCLTVILTIMGLFSNNEIINFISYILGGVSIIALIKPVIEFYKSSVFLNARKIKGYIDSPAMDPYELASEYFQTLVNQGKGKKNLAIFIDDLDRCKPKNAVTLLEGIQTLFKGNEINVFYLVSAEKLWLKECFENEYREQRKSTNGESIGYQYLEKLFQVSVRLPNSNKKTDESLIDKILGLYNEAPTENYEKSNSTNKNVAERQENRQIAAIPIIPSKKQLEIEETHLLTKLHHYVGTNPRILKKIINSYEINRFVISLEKSHPLTENQLEIIMKCTIMEERWPDVMMAIEQKVKIVESLKDGHVNELKDLDIDEKLLKELASDNTFNSLLFQIQNEDYPFYFGIDYKSIVERMYPSFFEDKPKN